MTKVHILSHFSISTPVSPEMCNKKEEKYVSGGNERKQRRMGPYEG
jgi:hypothetical protein